MSGTYQQQDSPLTLQQGLEEYYAHNPGLIAADNCSNDAVATLFQRHDVIHVLFGCSTSLHDETLADTWTIFGSTVTLKEYLSYLKYSETIEVLNDIKIPGMIWEIIKAIPNVFRVIGRTRKMDNKWRWADYQSYLDVPLKELRQEFGIHVIVGKTPDHQSTPPLQQVQ